MAEPPCWALASSPSHTQLDRRLLAGTRAGSCVGSGHFHSLQSKASWGRGVLGPTKQARLAGTGRGQTSLGQPWARLRLFQRTWAPRQLRDQGSLLMFSVAFGTGSKDDSKMPCVPIHPQAQRGSGTAQPGGGSLPQATEGSVAHGC